MAAQTVARAIFMRRQRDGLAGGLAGGVVESRGGRVRDLPGNLFSDDGDDQPCVDPCSCEFGLLAGSMSRPAKLLNRLKASSICQRKR